MTTDNTKPSTGLPDPNVHGDGEYFYWDQVAGSCCPPPNPATKDEVEVHTNGRSASIHYLSDGLLTAQSKFKAPPKNHVANAGSYKYKYADLTDVIKAVAPGLTSGGLSFTQMPQSEGNMVSVTTMLMHTSGEWISSTLSHRFEGGPQQLGGMITYLKRYALTAMLGISADEDTDLQETRKDNPTDTRPTPKAPSKLDAAKSKLAGLVATHSGLSIETNRAQIGSDCRKLLKRFGFEDTKSSQKINAACKMLETALTDKTWKEFMADEN